MEKFKKYCGELKDYVESKWWKVKKSYEKLKNNVES
jgi:hypothetical protein